MSQDALEIFLNKYKELPKSTFFVHRYTQGIPRSIHYFNPHPTYTDLELNNDLDKLENMSNISKNGIRSHSCTNSHLLSLDWAKRGYTYQSVYTALGNTQLKPFIHPWNIWEMPIFYMDNMVIWAQKNLKSFNFDHNDFLQLALDSDSPYIFDFHPIHIALNTSSTTTYAMAKDLVLNSGANPWNLSGNNYGIRNFFEKVLAVVLAQKFSDVSIESIIDRK
jgi:hypothetical protein